MEFLYANNFCWLVQLLGIACLKDDSTKIKPQDNKDHTCGVQYDEAGLMWDGICLAFLLVQKRIFGSSYFRYLVKEIRAQQLLASRGAELIHEIQAKEVADQEQAEKEVMEKIKQKMDRIKATQQKIYLGLSGQEIKFHKQGNYFYFKTTTDFAIAALLNSLIALSQFSNFITNFY